MCVLYPKSDVNFDGTGLKQQAHNSLSRSASLVFYLNDKYLNDKTLNHFFRSRVIY